ncbi:NVEALA domain-containing protein [Bacteroides fragilis]|uniref:NVEALA domain-containing protein n=1 Tax=Bacteroides hominis TaxID=2763023 RepID=UPI0010717B46
MKKRIIMILFATIVAVVAGYNIYQAKKPIEMSELALLNIEALAHDESNYWPKPCYMFTSTTMLPDEPQVYVLKCIGCVVVKSGVSLGDKLCNSTGIW